MSSALSRSAAIISFAALPPFLARLLAALIGAVLLMLVGAAPAAAQKYAQIVHTEEPYASAGIYVRYGSQFESLFDRSYVRTAVQILNRIADAQKKCDRAAWIKDFHDFENLVQIAYEYAASREGKVLKLQASYPHIGNSYFYSPEVALIVSQLAKQAFEANEDYRALYRLYQAIPPWQPCGQKTQAQLPPAPPSPPPAPPPKPLAPMPPPAESPVRPQDQVMMGPGPIFPGAQPFVGINVSGGFQNTNFSVSDTGFNVNGSGVMGGGFVGVLLPIPNTNALAGFRVGGQGGNVTGDIRMPALSPTFNYTVRTEWMAYQEAMVRIPVSGFKIAPNESPLPRDRVFFTYDYFNQLPHLTGSVGVAESGTSVKGTSGMFSVTDNAVRTGITFTVGAEWPVATLPNGGVVDLFAQYRGTQFISTVSVPGGVNIGSFTNQVDIGATVHFGEGVSWNVRY
jgi:hypothetical protein